jgi:sirohydrochlorin cobaltochelatase
VAERKSLESARRLHGESEMTPREAALDRTIRNWPRTLENDPYFAGLQVLAQRLARRLRGRRLIVAFNEFCAPSVGEAIDTAVRDGALRVDVVTTMFTPGGSHSEREIPELIAAARRSNPGVDIRYAWPFDLDRVADFLARHVDEFASEPDEDVAHP